MKLAFFQYEFALVSFELEEKYCTSMPKFLPHFKKLKATLLEYVFLPSKKNKSVPITYVVAPWMAKFKISQANWAAKSIIEKETWFLKFLKGTPKAEKAAVKVARYSFQKFRCLTL